jgi:hypothetical protein
VIVPTAETTGSMPVGLISHVSTGQPGALVHNGVTYYG